MRSDHLEDLIHWGMNTAARAIGAETDAYRPSGPNNPMAPSNRFLRLPASFSGSDGSYKRPSSYGQPICYGTFDAAYTRAGDYLQQDQGVWFIAAQRCLLPVLCVRTNRVVSFVRPSAPSTAGSSTYGGVTAANTTSLMAQWPASMLSLSREVRSLAALPADSPASLWTVLLPAWPGVVLRTGDLMSDDLGRSGTVSTTELTDLGWRLAVRQVTT